MSQTAFSEFFPDIAEKETRVVIPVGVSYNPLHDSACAFIELYCTDPECDCRNVRIHVFQIKSQKVVATITYGWEPIEFYKEWMFGEEEDFIIENFKGPALALLSPQSRIADQWLEIFKETLKEDKDYADRLNRHYQLVKRLENA
jgi:hypothetical protein